MTVQPETPSRVFNDKLQHSVWSRLNLGRRREGINTYKTVGHDAVEAFERLHVFVGEEELNHSRVPEQVTQSGLKRKDTELRHRTRRRPSHS